MASSLSKIKNSRCSEIHQQNAWKNGLLWEIRTKISIRGPHPGTVLKGVCKCVESKWAFQLKCCYSCLRLNPWDIFRSQVEVCILHVLSLPGFCGSTGSPEHFFSWNPCAVEGLVRFQAQPNPPNSSWWNCESFLKPKNRKSGGPFQGSFYYQPKKMHYYSGNPSKFYIYICSTYVCICLTIFSYTFVAKMDNFNDPCFLPPPSPQEKKTTQRSPGCL